jgi:hypothetical protein
MARDPSSESGRVCIIAVVGEQQSECRQLGHPEGATETPTELIRSRSNDRRWLPAGLSRGIPLTSFSNVRFWTEADLAIRPITLVGDPIMFHRRAD